uniref:Uncharacterized protein n=1 Tax=Anopheles arabiensis TaxID=7173 RepID=A0A182IFG3_ANOAR
MHLHNSNNFFSRAFISSMVSTVQKVGEGVLSVGLKQVF